MPVKNIIKQYINIICDTFRRKTIKMAQLVIFSNKQHVHLYKSSLNAWWRWIIRRNFVDFYFVNFRVWWFSFRVMFNVSSLRAFEIYLDNIKKCCRKNTFIISSVLYQVFQESISQSATELSVSSFCFNITVTIWNAFVWYCNRTEFLSQSNWCKSWSLN